MIYFAFSIFIGFDSLLNSMCFNTSLAPNSFDRIPNEPDTKDDGHPQKPTRSIKSICFSSTAFLNLGSKNLS